MRAILKGKWAIVIIWIAITVGLLFIAPNMAELVKEKGQLDVPKEYSSGMANELLKQVQNEDESQVALVFHSEKKLTADERQEIEKGIQRLEVNKGELGIKEILTHFKEPSLKEQLVSKDQSTILTSITMTKGDREAKDVIDALYKELDQIDVDHYYTSSWIIDEDLNTNSQEGLKKTEGITVIFILVVLLVVFRSVVTPLIPMITVGFTYLCSQSIVSFLVDRWDFPISSYTQIFLVGILFGIGTDYCILLLSRFKEELSGQESLTEAIVETYRTAGKTVFFSGLTVMIGFAAIGFSTFKLYQSAAAVAIGVFILMVALYTIVPFFMAVLGKKLFWPSKGKLEHSDSKLWGRLGNFSLNRPLLALLIVAIVCVPFLFMYEGKISYNSLEEAGNDVPSIMAFNIMADEFGPGQSMPTQIVIQNDERMDSEDYVGLAEKISVEITKVDDVDVVRSVTRPTGEPIEDLFVSNQAKTLEKGIGEGNQGIEQISDGLKTAGSELSESGPRLKKATDGIGGLISGTNELKNGVGQVETALTSIEAGIRDGSLGTEDVKKGLEEVKSNLEKLATGSGKLLEGYQQSTSGLNELKGGYKDIQTNLNEVSKSLTGLNASFEKMEASNPELQQDVNYQTIKQTVQGAQSGVGTMAAGLTELNKNLGLVSGGLNTANKSMAEIVNGQKALGKGLTQLITGVDTLQKGLTTMANGQSEVIKNLSQFEGGLTSLSSGQQELLNGFSSMGGQLNQLEDGLNKSADGLNEVHDGLSSAQGYLSGLAKTDKTVTGMYIPKEVLESKEFGESLNTYLSDDGKVMTLDVIFKTNPYSNESIEQIDRIEDAVKNVTKGTKLENANIAIGGITSTHHDLSMMSEADFSKTVVLMLSGIAIVLFFMFRSLVMPIYLIVSLVLTYFTAAAITELIFVNILGYAGIGWAVPFFAFVILIALGIDYSIFLMDRFNEWKGKPVKEAMYLSMRKMGTVIISAAVILGGTFAAMMPAGVLSLLEIATLILVGLALYAFIILPLFIPVMVATFGKANWWPFMNQQQSEK
ncbi:MMPL family transporter [Peribacillus sp. NPDC097198]|uniref:MMPL family transporter n=1 Tax=Peribacillus sp. NPDC097198 TaxID=3364397 RepID=UPI00381C77B6